MTLKTRLEILDARYAEQHSAAVPKARYEFFDHKKDAYAENQIGSGDYQWDDLVVLNSRALETQEVTRVRRNRAVVVAYERSIRPPVRKGYVERIAKHFGISKRQVSRIVHNASKGQGITLKRKPRVDTHKFLTAGIFKTPAQLPSIRGGA